MNSYPGSQPNTNTSVIDFESGIGPITDKIINGVFDVITNKDFNEKISNKLVTPLTQIVNDKIKPYIYISGFLYLIIITLLLIIISLISNPKK